METLLALLGNYYGIDWLTLGFGIASSLLVTNQKLRLGLMAGIITCIGGLIVASMSGQTGFVVYYGLIICINIRGILSGDRRGHTSKSKATELATTQPEDASEPAPAR